MTNKGRKTQTHLQYLQRHKKKQINLISIDLWDTKIQPGLILCAIMGL